jgi:hypothetical protein
MQLEDNKSDNTEKVELVRELIIGPDKKAIEAQIMGMKELFTSILSENRKEYDRQVSDMKGLFVSILEENRNSFRQQLTELQAILPQVVQNTLLKGQNESYVVLADESKEREMATKYTKIEAVKEIILGRSIDQMQERVAEVDLTIEKNYNHQMQALAELSQQVSQELERVSQSLSASLDSLVDSLQLALQNQDNRSTYRSVLSSFFEEAGRKIDLK